MIDRKTEPVIGVERRLRVSPHISSLPGQKGMSFMGHFRKGCKYYSKMHIHAPIFTHISQLIHSQNRIFMRVDSGNSGNYGCRQYPHIICYGSICEPPGVPKFPEPPDRSKTQNFTGSGGKSPCLLLGGCAPQVQNTHRFHNKKNRPFLTRLAGDPIGKEADGETTIGDKNNVTKCIN